VKLAYLLILLDLCNSLLDYCRRLLPETERVEAVTEEAKFENLDTFKNEAGQALVSKKDRVDDFYAATKSKGKGRKKKSKRRKKRAVPLEQQGQQALQHQFDILQFFTEVHVGVPHFENQLENTIKQLEEKVDYYVNLPPPEDEKKPKRKRRRDDGSDDDAHDGDNSDDDKVVIDIPLLVPVE